MHCYDQRKLAIEYFPELKEKIMDKANGYKQIIQLIVSRGLRHRFLEISRDPRKRFLEDWALNWARFVREDKEAMKRLITSSSWAFLWALEFPEDKEDMRMRVHESEWSYYWALKFPEDAEIMRMRVKNPYWKCEFEKKFWEEAPTELCKYFEMKYS